MTFCEGCGQPAVSTTKAGSPICPSCQTVKQTLTVEVAEYVPRGGDHVMIWVNQRRTDLGGYCIEGVPRHIAPKLVAAIQADAAPVAWMYRAGTYLRKYGPAGGAITYPIIATKGARRFLIDRRLPENPDIFSGFYLNSDGSLFEKTLTTGEGGRYNYHRSHFSEELP